MRQREDGHIETVRAAHRFIARHDELRAVTTTGAYVWLGELLDSIDRRAAEQATEGLAAQSATQTALAARQALIDNHMKPIAAMARMLASDHPELQSVKMPRSYRGMPALITHAIAMGAEAAKWKAEFVELGLPDDFVEQMDVAIERFKEATARPREHRGARHGATKGAEAELKAAKKRLRVLDSFVRSAVPNNPALLAEWRLVKRFPRRKQARDEVAPAAQVARIAEALPPLMLPASVSPMEAIVRDAETEPARPARWTLRGLFRT